MTECLSTDSGTLDLFCELLEAARSAGADPGRRRNKCKESGEPIGDER